MYSIADYLWMLADDTRATAYAEAVRRAVRPGDRVLDVGAGFGFFSVLAARAGAARVDAVDVNPTIHLGPRLAAANGCADRIVFHELDVERLELPHEADVVISDLRGPTPFARRSLATIIDVRRRLLRRGGTIVPLADTMFVAPCRVPGTVQRDLHAAFGREGIDTSPVERIVHDTPIRCVVRPEDLLAPGRPWCRINYATVDTTAADGGADWTFDEAGGIAGFAVWFDTELVPGVGFSLQPGSPTRIYNQVFVPLRAPIRIEGGSRVRITLMLRLVLDDYVWAWRVFVTERSGVEREVASQNSIADAVLDPAVLRRRAGQV